MSDFSKKKIVVLDDDRIQHILLRKKIQHLTPEVQLNFFESASGVLEFLETESPDVILTDLNLDQMDGWGFVDELAKLNYQGRLYILTGSIMADDRIRAASDPRITGFFEKPLSETDLLRIVTD